MENKNNTVHLLKLGEEIVFGKTGVDYELEPGVVYIPKVDHYSDEISLKISNSLTLPEKLYVPASDRHFINKVLNSFNNSEKTLGVLLAGTKGTGKTVMAKTIAKESGLPILTIDNSLCPSYLNQLFTKLETDPMCIIFDEFDKLGERYDSDAILRVLDGVSSSGKHLLIFTCNETNEVNEYMLDRCSRIRYYRNFEEMGPSMISEILNDRLEDKTQVSTLTDFISANFGLISFDNVASFADEVNAYSDETYVELLNDMNISVKD